MAKETSVYKPAPAAPASIPEPTGSPASTRYTPRPPAPPAEVEAAPASGAAAADSAVPQPGPASGGTYVPAPRTRMLEALPAQYLETRPPLMYRLVTEAEAPRTYTRIAKSQSYRANAFSCSFFYKPISRCLIEWED